RGRESGARSGLHGRTCAYASEGLLVIRRPLRHRRHRPVDGGHHPGSLEFLLPMEGEELLMASPKDPPPQTPQAGEPGTVAVTIGQGVAQASYRADLKAKAPKLRASGL